MSVLQAIVEAKVTVMPLQILHDCSIFSSSLGGIIHNVCHNLVHFVNFIIHKFLPFSSRGRRVFSANGMQLTLRRCREIFSSNRYYVWEQGKEGNEVLDESKIYYLMLVGL